jgi:hypothetical protein
VRLPSAPRISTDHFNLGRLEHGRRTGSFDERRPARHAPRQPAAFRRQDDRARDDDGGPGLERVEPRSFEWHDEQPRVAHALEDEGAAVSALDALRALAYQTGDRLLVSSESRGLGGDGLDAER